MTTILKIAIVALMVVILLAVAWWAEQGPDQ